MREWMRFALVVLVTVADSVVNEIVVSVEAVVRLVQRRIAYVIPDRLAAMWHNRPR